MLLCIQNKNPIICIRSESGVPTIFHTLALEKRQPAIKTRISIFIYFPFRLPCLFSKRNRKVGYPHLNLFHQLKNSSLYETGLIVSPIFFVYLFISFGHPWLPMLQ